MMLQALVAYAEREHLGDPDFESVGVRWQISLDGKGKLVGLIPLLDDPDAKKPRPKRLLRPFTEQKLLTITSQPRSHFLCDSLERAAGVPNPKAGETAGRRRASHEFFKSLLREAVKMQPTESANARAVLAFLDDRTQLDILYQRLEEKKAKPTDNATFAIDGTDLLDSQALKRFWRDRRAKSINSGKARRICIATGELAETVDTTEKIKGVPGGLATGTSLISFDKEAFCSFGLEQARNAALSAPAELKIRSALNALIQNSRKQGLVFNDTVHLHWSRQPMELDPMKLLTSADPDAVAELLKSVQDGRPVIGLDANAYYALSFSGNGARIVVRDWLESTVPEVQRHVAQWFEDVTVVTPDGIGLKRDFKLAALLYGMVRKKIDELPPQLPTQLLHGALRGRSIPLPQSALIAALRRQQLDQENKLLPSRMALIKACLIRSPNRSGALPTKEDGMTEGLNPDVRDPAYLCGRLFAVFDRLQYLALGGVNAGVVERYYASASNTPALVMGRLFRNAQFHLGKAEGGVAENVRKDFEAITSALGQQFPATLTLEGQGRFAIGYYHQKAEYRRRSAERKAESAH